MAEVMDRLEQYADAARDRWIELIHDLPPDAGRMPLGRYELEFLVEGVNLPNSLAALLEGIRIAGQTRLTGWGPFITMTREGLAPYLRGENVEAWLGSPEVDRYRREPGHCNFRRASRRGEFFLTRGLDEDDWERVPPGEVFDLTLPVWRVGEAMLFVARFALASDPDAVVTTRVTYYGLEGRVLRSVSGRRAVFHDRRSRDDTWSNEVRSGCEIEQNLTEILHPFLSPLYERFEFFELPVELVAQELEQLFAQTDSELRPGPIEKVALTRLPRTLIGDAAPRAAGSAARQLLK